MKKWIAALVFVALAQSFGVSADVSITSKEKVRAARLAKKAARVAKREAKQARRAQSGRRPLGNGDLTLVDAAGMQYFFDTNITTSSDSSASAALSEASYSHAVAASTSLGGVSSTTLNDMVDDPYNAECVNIGGTAAMPCVVEGGGKNISRHPKGRRTLGPPGTWNLYFGNGAPTTDCNGREYLFGVQDIGGIQASRRIYVPTYDTFARWLDVFTNPTGAPITIKLGTLNNLGSDDSTVIVTSSNGTATVNTSTTWVTTFQAFSGGSSGDPRIGHVLRGPGAVAVGLTDISFNDGDEAPYWSYVMTIPAGGTQIIMNFVTGQGTKAAAAAKAAQLTSAPDGACMTDADKAAVQNFVPASIIVGGPPTVPALSRTALLALVAALAIAAAFSLRKPF